MEKAPTKNLNMKALVGAFNQEKAFSVIVKNVYRRACTIPDPVTDTVLVTGGYWTRPVDIVSR